MKLQELPTIPRAIVGTANPAVREFLTVHLEDRGFAVEQVYRAEYLRVVASDSDLLFADAAMFQEAEIPADDRPHAVYLLSHSPSADEAFHAAMEGVRRYLAIPFTDPPALAATLDVLAAEARDRIRIRDLDLVAAR